MKIKKILGFTLIMAVLLSFSSCYSSGHHHRRVPPGHAKKVYRGKPGKRHAPGQKKHKKSKRHSRHQNLFPR